MKNKKITTSLLTAGMVLAIGITPFVHSNTMEAATLISQSDHEKSNEFYQERLKRSKRAFNWSRRQYKPFIRN